WAAMVLVIPMSIISCTKEKVAQPDETLSKNTELFGISPLAANRPPVDNPRDPLTVGLEGWFTFNNNLKDQTKKLPDGVPTTRVVLYTQDRKGNAKAAIKFNGTYGITLEKVPQQTNSSIALWVKYDKLGGGRLILKPNSTGLGLYKTGAEVYGSIEHSSFGSLGIQALRTDTNKWFHFVVTFDGNKFRVYQDGNFAREIELNHTLPSVLEKYFLGYWQNGGSFEWFEGSVDDLRFYSRALSASEANQLYKL
ncbi:MAG TPA: LamG domain-containing protein, partial [Phnomibacter sp.]|nr:LamG domain-containing protein [Phnomibacter sp.]